MCRPEHNNRPMSSTSGMGTLDAMTIPKALSAIFLLIATVGIYVQIVGGNVPDYPAVPPGALVLVAGAAIVAFVPWRWAPVAAILVALFMIVGLFGAGQATRLIEVDTFLDTLGLWIQMVAVVVALVTGVVAIVRPAPSPSPRA
jgi:hypothetical protein